jgi:hypothetical protein
MSCRETKCAKESALLRQQNSKLMKDITKLDTLKDKRKITETEYKSRVSKLGNSATERKGMRDNLACTLRNCFSDHEKAITSMLKGVDEVCKKTAQKEGCEKVKEIKASLKNGMISVEQYAWLHKFLLNIDLKI